jgi:hypothetical protein
MESTSVILCFLMSESSTFSPGGIIYLETSVKLWTTLYASSVILKSTNEIINADQVYCKLEV